jgi:hypothetical protein
VKHSQIGRVSEVQVIKLPRPEPPDGVMLFWLQVRDTAPPAPRDPHGEIQADPRIDPAQDRAAINTLKLSAQLLGYLPPERICRPLTRPDVTTREVPHIRIPPPAR